jgi:hypothetical protein
MKARRVLTVLAPIGFALVLAACGPKGDTAAGTPSPASDHESSTPSASPSPSSTLMPAPGHSTRPPAGPSATEAAQPPSQIAPDDSKYGVTKVKVGANGRTLTLTYEQSEAGCGIAWHGHDSATSSRIVVWVTLDHPKPAPGAAQCGAISTCFSNCDRTLSITLDSPVANRPIYDASTGKRRA